MDSGHTDQNSFEFRPGVDAWLGRVFLPVAFLIILGVTAINLFASNPGLMWLVLAMLPTIGLVGGAYAVPVVLGRISVSRSSLWANVDGMRLNFPWKDVRAIRVSLQNSEPYLQIGVGSGLFVIPLRHFKTSAVWEAVRQTAPEESLYPDAFTYYERKDGNEGISPDLWMVGSLRVADSRGLSLAASLGVAGFLFLFVVMLINGIPGAPVFLAFSVLYLLVLLSIGTTELDLRGVTRRTVMGTSRILWDEMSGVLIGPFGLRIVLEGPRKRRLVLFGPPMWTGVDAARAVHFLALQISTRRLPRRRSLAVLFMASRNTSIEGEG